MKFIVVNRIIVIFTGIVDTYFVNKWNQTWVKPILFSTYTIRFRYFLHPPSFTVILTGIHLFFEYICVSKSSWNVFNPDQTTFHRTQRIFLAAIFVDRSRGFVIDLTTPLCNVFVTHNFFKMVPNSPRLVKNVNEK